MLNVIANEKINNNWLELLLKHPAIYNFIIGGRNGRKSSKIQEKILNDYLNKNECFILIRRKTDETVTENWFTPYVQSKLLKEHNKLITFKKSIIKGERYTGYFIISDTNGHNPEIIGKVMYLSMEQKYKSNEAEFYKRIKNVVFEEFIAKENSAYLTNEVQALVNLISTIFRDRKASIYLIGNTLEGQESNPYFRYFEIDDLELTVNKMYILKNEFDVLINVLFVANILPDDIPEYQKIKGNLVGTSGEWTEDRNFLRQNINELKAEIKQEKIKLLYRGKIYYIYSITENEFKRPYIYFTSQVLKTAKLTTLEEFKQTIPPQHRNYKNNVLHALYPKYFVYDSKLHTFIFKAPETKEKFDIINIDNLNLKKAQSKTNTIKQIEMINQIMYNIQFFCDNKSLLYWLKCERKEYIKAVLA